MNINGKTRELAFFGIMLALVAVLSYIEHMFPPLPLLPPNVKLGLSNIVTMYCLFFIGKRDAVLLTSLKSVFVLLTRGPVAGLLSFCGGILSIFTIIALLFIFKDSVSYLICSIAGAIAHNLGQILGASILLKFNLLFYYFPISIIAGVVMGIVTGTLLRVTLPLFARIRK